MSPLLSEDNSVKLTLHNNQTSYPEKLWMLQPWKCLKPGWMGLTAPSQVEGVPAHFIKRKIVSAQLSAFPIFTPSQGKTSAVFESYLSKQVSHILSTPPSSFQI